LRQIISVSTPNIISAFYNSKIFPQNHWNATDAYLLDIAKHTKLPFMMGGIFSSLIWEKAVMFPHQTAKASAWIFFYFLLGGILFSLLSFLSSNQKILRSSSLSMKLKSFASFVCRGSHLTENGIELCVSL